MVTGTHDESVMDVHGETALAARTPQHHGEKEERRGAVLSMTEDMMRRYSSPLAPSKMSSLKIDGSRRAERIRQVSCATKGHSPELDWVGSCRLR